VHSFQQSLRGFPSIFASPRLIAQPGIVQHRPFERRAGRQALDFIGKACLEGTVVSRDRRADDGRTSPSYSH